MVGRVRKPARKIALLSSDTESDDDVINRRRSKRANLPKNPNPTESQDDTFVGGDDDDFFEEGRDHYMKIATDVVDKNVKLTKLFDPDVMQGFTMLMNKSEKVGQATKAMEACTKVYTQKVDTLHTNVQKLSSTMVRVEDKPKAKEKRVAFAEKNLDDWLAEAADDLNNSGAQEGMFSGEEEDENRPILREAEMTVMGDILRDQTLLPGSQDLDMSLTIDDDSESFALGNKIKAFAKNRSLLTGGKKLTLEQLELRFARADAATQSFNNMERLKKFGKVRQKKEVEVEEPTNNFSTLDAPLFNHAKANRGETSYVSLEDVAETSDDCSLIFLHNQWKEIDELERLPKMNEELEDWTLDDDLIDEKDMVSTILEHIQGTLENATTSEPTLPDELIDLFGLSKKDLKKVRHMESYLNVSFEQTTSSHIDEANMVDQLENPQEEESVKKELERVNLLVLELFKERADLPGKAQNPRETSIRQEMHRPKYTKCFDDEDEFFNYDFRIYITKETMDKEIAHVSRIWMKSLTKKMTDSLKIPEALFNLLKTSAQNRAAFSQDLLDAFKLIPDYVYGKFLLLDPDVGINFGEEMKRLEFALLPFRISRYAQFVVSTVLHEAQKADLSFADFQRPMQSRAASVLMQSRAGSVMHTTFNNVVTPSKRQRLDDTIPEGWTYFFAKERNYWKRYTDQELYDETKPLIRELLIMTILSERAEPITKGDNDPAVLDGFWALITAVRYYEDHGSKDLTDHLTTERLPVIEDEEDLPDIEITAEREEILNNLAVIEAENVNNEERNNDFDVDWDFQTAPHSPINAPTLQQSMSSIELFNGDNEAENVNNDVGHERSRPEPIDIDFPDFDDDNEKLNDSFAAMLQDFHEPNEDLCTPTKKARRFTRFVEDDAHYEEDMTKKKEKRKKFDDAFGEQLAFAPRNRMEHVSTSRRASRTTEMEIATIIRNPVTLPVRFKTPMTFRVDDQLVLTIAGMGDINRMFVPVPILKNSTFSPHATLYKGEYSQLPPTSTTRQDEDLLFFTRYHYLVRQFQDIRISEAAAQNDIDNDDDVDLNMSIDGGNDIFFDAPESISFHEQNSGRSEVIINVDDFEKEYGNASLDSDMEIDEDDDTFDFESHITKREARVITNYKFKLKRAIKFILSRKFLDRSSISENINGLPIPPSYEQDIFTSTPSKLKFRPENDIVIDDEDILTTNIEVSVDDEDNDDSIIRQETDETRMKAFKIQGFHTFRSVLYYLPTYCCPETVETLSTAHIFSILCHMANENTLHVTQEMYAADDDVDERIDYVIEDYDTWIARLADNEIDDLRRSDDDDEE